MHEDIERDRTLPTDMTDMAHVEVLVIGEEGSIKALETALDGDEPVLVLEPDWIMAEPPSMAMTVGTAVITGAALAALTLYVRQARRRRHVRRITIIE